MTYTPKTDWVDTPSHATPVLAADLIRIEEGIAGVETEALAAAAAAAAASQPVDADLTAMAALDSTQAGVVASDGAGWLRKTYAAVKTALGLTKGDVGLGNVDNTSDVNKPVSTAQLTALNLKAPLASPTFTGTVTVPTPVNPTDAATRQYVDTAVTGLLDFRGSYDASPNTFPAAGGSGTAGAVVKGDVWICSVGGTLGGVAVTAGDLIVALADAPGQTAASWDLVPHDGAYVTLAGNQTVAGIKTFSSSPIVPTPAAADNSTKTASTAYVDAAIGPKAAVLTRTAVKTSNYTAALWDLVPCDTSGGAWTFTLPAASSGKGRIAVKLVTAGNTLNLALTGTDHFNTAAGPTTGTLTITNQGIIAESDGSGIWTVTADDLPLTGLDARYLQKSNNLSDVTPATARTNLGLGSAATVNTGTTNGTIPLLGASGTVAPAQLGTGTPTGTKFLRDDGTYVTLTGGPIWTATKTGAYTAATGDAVPMDVTSRWVTDAVLNSTTTVTSATAAFASPADVGKLVTGTGIPVGTTIASVTNSTTIILSAAATATGSGATLGIGGSFTVTAPGSPSKDALFRASNVSAAGTPNTATVVAGSLTDILMPGETQDYSYTGSAWARV